MRPVSFNRHRFPPDVIRLAVWLYFRFTLSFRDGEEMLAQRGIEASHETVRCWTLKFGRAFAQNLRRCRPRPTGRWHLDEMVVKIRGQRMWPWRAVDDEGEVSDMLVQTSGELASGHSTTEAQTTEVQVSTFSATVSRDSRRHPQQLQRSKTPDPPIDPAPVQGPGPSHLGSGDRGRLSDRSLPAHCALDDLT